MTIWESSRSVSEAEAFLVVVVSLRPMLRSLETLEETDGGPRGRVTATATSTAPGSPQAEGADSDQ